MSQRKPETVGFNVEGTVFTTVKSIIETIPKSFLYVLVFGNIPSETDIEGNFVIHRNPAMFQDVLDVYRNKAAILPTDRFQELKFLEELKFYQLDHLAKKTTTKETPKKPIRLVSRSKEIIENDALKISSYYAISENIIVVTWVTLKGEFTYFHDTKITFHDDAKFSRYVLYRSNHQFVPMDRSINTGKLYSLSDYKSFSKMEEASIANLSSMFIATKDLSGIVDEFQHTE